jgi:hypothetical protein
VTRANALGRGADVEPEAARRTLDQVRLGIGGAVHASQPSAEDVDLMRACELELETLLVDLEAVVGITGEVDGNLPKSDAGL